MKVTEMTRPAGKSAMLAQLPIKPLKEKTALVTGSTSGIGLGIARALAQAGCNVVLNGFGDPKEIERERAQIADDFGVSAAFDPADLAEPVEIARMIEALRDSGVSYVLLTIAGGVDQLRRFAREIMPAFAHEPTARAAE